MKHKFRAVTLTVLIILSLSLLLYSLISDNSVDTPVEPVIAKTPEYFLRLEDDEIIIYKDGEAVETGIAVSDMRRQDRILLESGIHADSYEDVLKLIEDFNS